MTPQEFDRSRLYFPSLSPIPSQTCRTKLKQLKQFLSIAFLPFYRTTNINSLKADLIIDVAIIPPRSIYYEVHQQNRSLHENGQFFIVIVLVLFQANHTLVEIELCKVYKCSL